MPVIRPRGWLPEPGLPEAVIGAHRSHTSFLAAQARPLEGGLEREVWELFQEGESCTGHFAVESTYGLTGIKCSPYPPWWAARAYDAPLAPIRNVGCSTASFVRALREHGACEWRHWNPESFGFDINKVPPGLARLNGQRHKLDLVPLYGDREQIVEAALVSLSRGCPVGIVVGTTEQFDRPIDGEIGPIVETVPGDHIVTGWRYRQRDGRRQVLAVNYWPNWGIGNCAWLDESWIAASEFVCSARGVLPAEAT